MISIRQVRHILPPGKKPATLLRNEKDTPSSRKCKGRGRFCREEAMKSIAFVGLTNLDFVYYVDSMPKENEKCRTYRFKRTVGGPAANAAITCALLGGKATLLTAFGTSGESRLMKEELESFGVNCINLSAEDSQPGVSAICISPNGERTIISGQVRYDFTDEAKLSGLTDELLHSFDGALFDCNQTDLALPILNRLECETVLDAGSYKEHTEEFLKKASVIISSEKFRDSEGNDVFRMNCPKARFRAVTRGAAPILLEEGQIDITPADCIDSLGAGDILHGAFCFFYFEKQYPFRKALELASEVASESVRYEGPRAWSEHIRREWQ